jgi:hypothetical protein
VSASPGVLSVSRQEPSIISGMLRREEPEEGKSSPIVLLNVSVDQRQQRVTAMSFSPERPPVAVASVPGRSSP